jgi:hypothetical protein
MTYSRGRWAGFALAGMVATAPASAWAQPAAPAHAAAPAGRTITPELRAKMLKLISTMGRDSEIPASIASPLGLTAAGVAWPNRQFAFQLNGGGALHAAAIGRGADQDIILTTRGPAAITVFRARADGTLQGAVNYFLQTNQPIPLPSAEAQAEFAAELAFWAANIDAVIDQN